MNDMGTAGVAGRLTSSGRNVSDFAFQQWNALLEALPIGVYLCGADGAVTHFNRQAVELWGRTPGPDDRFCGSVGLHTPDGAPLPHDACPMADVLKTGIAAQGREVVIERPDGRRLDAVVNIVPLFDESGTLAGAVNCFQDVSEIKRIQAQAHRMEGWVRHVMDRSPVAMYSTDAAGRVLSYNAAAAKLWGRAPVIGKDLWCGSFRLYHPDGRPMPLETCPMATAIKTQIPVQGLEAVFERPDGTRGAFLAYPTLLEGEGGALMGAVNMLVDISDRKQAEDRQKILVDELNHRVKNTLASVQSLAAHSLRGDQPPREMRERFEARLLALSKAHDQLADRQWEDADLRTLATNVLAPYAADSQVRLEGPSVTVSAKVAVALSMALQELATNAVKYGPLSGAEGRVFVKWRIESPDRLVLEWREQGGPPVSPPSRRGFGTRFIEGAVASELGGLVDLSFEPSGVQCRIETPL